MAQPTHSTSEKRSGKSKQEQILTIAAMNIMGQRGKQSEIETLSKHTQVLGLCETWYKSEDVQFISAVD